MAERRSPLVRTRTRDHFRALASLPLSSAAARTSSSPEQSSRLWISSPSWVSASVSPCPVPKTSRSSFSLALSLTKRQIPIADHHQLSRIVDRGQAEVIGRVQHPCQQLERSMVIRALLLNYDQICRVAVLVVHHLQQLYTFAASNGGYQPIETFNYLC